MIEGGSSSAARGVHKNEFFFAAGKVVEIPEARVVGEPVRGDSVLVDAAGGGGRTALLGVKVTNQGGE